MNEIFHIVPIFATQIDIFQALVEEKELQKWWLPNASTSGKLGSIAIFPLSSGMGEIHMKIITLNYPVRVIWECTHHINEDWIGTIVDFEVVKTKTNCELQFRHRNWQNTKGVFGLVSFYWASLYLKRLKSLLEDRQNLHS